jgi:signal peptidase I
MENRPADRRKGFHGGKRLIAFLLCLILPGAGHFLLGHFHRGIVWAVGVTGVRLALLFALPIGLLPLVLAFAVKILGPVASAFDAVALTVRQPRWVIVLVGWGALGVGGLSSAALVATYTTHYAQSFSIPSPNMMDTLLIGDYIAVDMSIYRRTDPQRGDVIVFRYPQDERRTFIERIVGMPGDLISVRGREVVLNGTVLTEPYVRRGESALDNVGDTTVCRYAYGCDSITVPPDSYFVIGDNRDNSQDSRHWGFVKKEQVRGKAFAIYWSWDTDRHWLRTWRLGRPIL